MPKEMKWAIALAIGVGLIWVGWRVPYVLVTLYVMVCFVLVIVIMLQSGNAADLAGAFGGAGSQTAFGPRGAATFLSRATTWCAIIFMLSSLALSLKRPTSEAAGVNSILEQTQKTAPAPAKPKPSLPVIPASQNPPAQGPTSPAPSPAGTQGPAAPAPAQQPPAPKH